MADIDFSGLVDAKIERARARVCIRVVSDWYGLHLTEEEKDAVEAECDLRLGEVFDAHARGEPMPSFKHRFPKRPRKSRARLTPLPPRSDDQ